MTSIDGLLATGVAAFTGAAHTNSPSATVLTAIPARTLQLQINITKGDPSA